jgi:hypothetical protein
MKNDNDSNFDIVRDNMSGASGTVGNLKGL